MPVDYAADRPQGLSVDIVPAPPEGVGTALGSTREQEVACRWNPSPVAGVERGPFADVVFRLDCFRRTGQHAKVQLTMEQLDFGVNNCCTQNCSATNQSPCHKTCKTVFIYKMTIQVRPKSWAQNSHRLQVQPQHTAEVFSFQRSSTRSFQISFLNPKQASMTYQTENSVFQSASAFGWSPGYKDVSTNSVSWTWELYRFPNVRKLEFNKHKWGSRPPLGIRPSCTHLRPESLSASWEMKTQSDADLQQLRLEWDVKVTLHTAVFQSRRRLPGYSVTLGPTLAVEKILTFL